MSDSILAGLKKARERINPPPVLVSGYLTRVVGLMFEAVGVRAPIGSSCSVESAHGDIEAEVVGFENNISYLMPTQDAHGVVPGAKVKPRSSKQELPFGMELLGRVIDARGNPLDGRGPIFSDQKRRYRSQPVNPLNRRPVKQPLDVGVTAINACITVGQGQRMGLFAGSGVGKSVLLGMMTRGTDADVIVVGLIGERGREVKEFIEEILGEEGLEKSVVVAAPADQSPLIRLRGCEAAAEIAEYFRDQGLNVLLLMDSLTRYAMAQREIALAVGEPPATKGYPPSVFAKLPALVERAGNGGEGQGSVTAFYTVLTEGDDLQDPIADSSRAILDGHIVLSRELADSGHYPAIDIEASISRVMPQVVSDEHMKQAVQVRKWYSNYRRNRDLIAIGAYSKGSDPAIDQAIAMQPRVERFLQQPMKSVVSYDESLIQLAQVINPQYQKQG
ncbi:flagellar protein export ATPase FliI [Idiomarina seosinensis]|uniref:Flagellum-specific ATP synthase n=1 Tax=Idiomarina seosinensis TaxID=281739 RepID=A0A432ZBZ6_9GAMM|nr:flagellar protein export ATPase FliI [Idiomarina seosinensis]RUO75465.1 flagellum-specific ATP synthase FliI [Idiomarina seosinensis]